MYRTRGRRRVDVNSKPRDSLRHAIVNARGRTAPPGKIVAELMFGFWRFVDMSTLSVDANVRQPKSSPARCSRRPRPPVWDDQA